MHSTFDAFFRAATATEPDPKGNAPYDYQARLAGGLDAKADWPETLTTGN